MVDKLPEDVRKWWYYPIEFPVTQCNQGPATIGLDAAKITYEVWDRHYSSFGSFDYLPCAINKAIELNLNGCEYYKGLLVPIGYVEDPEDE